MELLVNGAPETEIDRPDSSQTLEDYLQSLNEEFAEMNRIVNPTSVNGNPVLPGIQ